MTTIAGSTHFSLDLWMTLIRSNPAFKPARDALIRRFFGLKMPVAAITADIQRFDRLFNSINEKTGRHTNNHTMLLVILDHLGADTGVITATDLEGYYLEMESLFFQYPPYWCEPDIADTLLAARERGQTISLLSNTGFVRGHTLRRFLADGPLAGVFSFQLYSDELLYAKPAPEIFEAVYQRVNALQERHKAAIIHIGDNPVADVAGAAAFGFRTALAGGGQTIRGIISGNG